MPGLNNNSSGLFSGASGLAVARAPASGLYNQWSGLSGGGANTATGFLAEPTRAPQGVS